MLTIYYFKHSFLPFSTRTTTSCAFGSFTALNIDSELNPAFQCWRVNYAYPSAVFVQINHFVPVFFYVFFPPLFRIWQRLQADFHIVPVLRSPQRLSIVRQKITPLCRWGLRNKFQPILRKRSGIAAWFSRRLHLLPKTHTEAKAPWFHIRFCSVRSFPYLPALPVPRIRPESRLKNRYRRQEVPTAWKLPVLLAYGLWPFPSPLSVHAIQGREKNSRGRKTCPG